MSGTVNAAMIGLGFGLAQALAAQTTWTVDGSMPTGPASFETISPRRWSSSAQPGGVVQPRSDSVGR